MKDIFAAQDEIARAVTGALQVKLLNAGAAPGITGSHSTNPDAYQAYLQAQHFLFLAGEKGNFEKALAYADQAIKLDANYAPGWALRSSVLSWMAAQGYIDTDEGFRRAREDAEHAIALDPNSAAGYLCLANIHLNYDLDWEGAEASLDKAAALQPGSADLLQYQSIEREMLGRLDEAIELQKRAIALDPLQVSSYVFLGNQYSVAGRYEEANAALQKALELNPHHGFVHSRLGENLLLRGRLQEALVEIQQEPEDNWKLFGEAMVYHALARGKDSDAALRASIATHPKDGAFQIAAAYAYRGETDNALEWLERAYRQRDSGLVDIKTDPLLSRLRQNPRYLAILKKMRLPQ
jgi:tetratricopeptide (TPR) repeat protein